MHSHYNQKSAIKELNADSYKISNGTLVACFNSSYIPSTEPVPTVNPVLRFSCIEEALYQLVMVMQIKAAKDAGKDVYRNSRC